MPKSPRLAVITPFESSDDDNIRRLELRVSIIEFLFVGQDATRRDGRMRVAEINPRRRCRVINFTYVIFYLKRH